MDRMDRFDPGRPGNLGEPDITGGTGGEHVQSHDEAAYRAGYARMMREVELGRAMGWKPTERMLVVALARTARIYASARRGKPVGGQHPDWLRGRADALRELLHRGVGAPVEGA